MSEKRAIGRPKSIDRTRLLDAAEEIVVQKGAAALTIDAVAKATGVTKGGVQYAFGTKEGLIGAMSERWDRAYDTAIAALAGSDPTPVAAITAHIEWVSRGEEDMNVKAAAILAALIQTPEHLASTRDWYRQRLTSLDASRPQDRQARLAFLATESMFMLRYFGLMEVDAAQWEDIFADIRALQDKDKETD